MIRIDIKRWIKDKWHGQTWFGYTYLNLDITAPPSMPRPGWYKNDSALVIIFTKMNDD